jgi:hypothetical protein
VSTERTTSAVPRLWRGGPTVRPEVREANARRRRVFALQAAIMALVGAIVGMLYWIRPIPAPRLVPIWAGRPESRALTPLPMAEADLRAFEGLRSFTLRERAAPGEDRIRLVGDLDELKSIRNVPVVVYLRAYARINVLPASQGEPGGVAPGQVMILPADADPVNPGKWVALRSALKALADCRSRNKLLLLDLAPPPADPSLDLLGLGFAGQIDEELKAVADPTRLTLTACSPGEVALASDDLGRSVFSFYLEEGLRGWADVDATGYRRDGIVSAADLAGFVSAHVDRWARQNRRARQRPVLYESGRRVSPLAIGDLDFPLTVLSRGRPGPHLTAAKPRAYPDWLGHGWRRLDHWRRGGSDRLAPWGFRRVEAALLWAEQAWRAGSDSARVRASLDADLSAFVTHQEKLRASPRPEPHSLAALTASGARPDPALLAEVKALAARATAPAPGPADEKKPAADDEGGAAAKGATDQDVAMAVFEVASGIPEPPAKAIVALDKLLRSRGAPRFLETLALRRLAEVAEADPAGWSPVTARRALEVAAKAGKAENRPTPLAWVRSALDQAAQVRHDGEVAFRERAAVTLGAADSLLAQANRLYEAVLLAQDAIEGARDSFDDATFLLPACAPYLEDAPQLEGPWGAAVSAAREVFDDLRHGFDGQADDTDPPPDDLGPRVEALRLKSATLRARLDEIRGYLSSRAEALSRPGGRGEADAVTRASIDALLATPLPSADARSTLRKIRHDLSRRLADETLRLDREPGGFAQDDAPDSDDPEAVDQALTASAARRARRSIDVLALGGLAETTLSPLAAALGKATSTGSEADWLALALGLRNAWVDRLPEALRAAIKDDDDDADRLSRALPPFATFSSREEVVTQLEDAATNPSHRLRAGLDSRLWSWLADRYQYEFNDVLGSDLLDETAREFRTLSPPQQRASIRFGPVPELPELTPEHSSAVLTLDLQVLNPGAGNPLVTIDVVGADPRWLRVRPSGRPDDPPSAFPLSLPTPPPGRLVVPLRVEMPAATETPPQRLPTGFLVRATVDGRSFHARVPVTLLPASERLKVLLSDDPEAPTSPRGDLSLRPVEGRQTFYLYLFNPTPRARKVSVVLKVGEVPVPGGTAALAVESGKVEKVEFARPPAPPAPGGAGSSATPAAEPELPELRGPLVVTVADADRADRVLASRTIRAEIASTAEYVRVVEARFQPTGPGDEKNRLSVTLRASGALTGPPCEAELVLPQDRIPVLVAPPTEGTFRGVVPSDGGALTLLADGLRLGNLGSEKGWFYVNIDARKRALVFRTSFAPRGDATTPRLDFEPALRLLADDVAAAGSRFKVEVEVDNPPPSSTLEVSLGRVGAAGFEPDVVFPARGPYRRRVGFGVRGGALAFEATEADWSIPIDTSGIDGRRSIRARLFRPDGSLVREAERPLTLDAGAPSDVRFVGLPTQAKRGTTLPVRATGRPSGSGTRQVVFFLGTPTADGKRPPDAKVTEGRPADPEKTVWDGSLRLPEDRKGPLPVGVEFISGIGRSSFATAEIEILDADPILRGDLRARLLEGDRPQAGLDVILYDSKGTPRGRGLTGPDGTVLFAGLEAGTYIVTGSKPSTPAAGRAVVNVAPGTTTPLDVDLLFRAR